MHASDLWHSPAWGPTALRTLLTPLSWLYAAGWQTYLGIYRSGLRRAREPHRPVVCVGNLTVGGSGKTPFTLYLAGLIEQSGRSVAVSLSGHGSPRSASASSAPEGDLSAAEWGDEAAMMRWMAPDRPLIVGRDRVRAAEIAHELYPDRVLVLDDGFQHLPLRKHLRIILDDPDPKNARCLPAGPYREPRGNRRRADLVFPGEFELDWGMEGPADPETRAPSLSPGAEIQLLSAIGNPARLTESLTGRGFRIVRELRLSDHDPLTRGNLFDGFDPGTPLVATAKDWVKLREREDARRMNLAVVWNEPRVAPEDRFREYLDAALAQVQ